jgi:putative lipoic acid-binding regulatory protein
VFILNKSNRRPVLAYPCRWVYKVIGGDEECLRKVIAQTVQDYPCTIALSSNSSTGKYCCLNVEMVVPNETVRIALYETLRNHPAVKIVL